MLLLLLKWHCNMLFKMTCHYILTIQMSSMLNMSDIVTILVKLYWINLILHLYKTEQSLKRYSPGSRLFCLLALAQEISLLYSRRVRGLKPQFSAWKPCTLLLSYTGPIIVIWRQTGRLIALCVSDRVQEIKCEHWYIQVIGLNRSSRHCNLTASVAGMILTSYIIS